MYIAVDFDGTCVTPDGFGGVGTEKPFATEALRTMVKMGHKLILWTCREDVPGDPYRQYLTEAKAWFQARGIPLAGVNETPVEREFRPDLKRKVFADLHIDDRNLGGFPGWRQSLRMVREMTLQRS